ncbi:MAG: methyltransferase domain-containing protein [Ignavibacteria bacterium]|jgi:SAM-dependent methyltransferase
MNNWYKEWFASDEYLELYKHRDGKDASKIIELILASISIPPNALILDSACGAGRHSIYLAERGYNVVGFDLSENLLNVARANSIEKKLLINYVRGDKRNIYFKRKFNLIVNLFTSFGYFQSDKENFAFINNSLNFLLDGSFFVIDYFNKNYLVENIVSETKRNRNGKTLIEKRFIENDRVIKEIIIKGKKSSRKFVESVKLYKYSIIVEHLQKIGYKINCIYGDYEGNSFEKNKSERLILICQK